LVVGTGESLHALGRNKLDKNPLFAGLGGNRHKGGIAGLLGDKNAVQNHLGLEGFFNGANSVN
jgi:hypothetical protein